MSQRPLKNNQELLLKSATKSVRNKIISLRGKSFTIISKKGFFGQLHPLMNSCIIHIKDFFDWFTEVKRFLNYMVIKEHKVKLAALSLKDETSAWWHQTIMNRARFK